MTKYIHKVLAEDLKRFKCHLKNVVSSSNGYSLNLSPVWMKGEFSGTRRREGVSALTSYFNNLEGKRLRPILMMLSARAVRPDKNLNKNHFDLAVIVELVHNAALVHDDVLDEAALRRNTDTYNHLWGNEIAVIFGDYLFARLFSHISRIKISGLLKIISDTVNQICVGELNHLLRRFSPYALSEDEYIEIIGLKTASLFALSTYGGASLSTKNRRFIHSLKEYGRNFGMAYQIMDDYKDIVTSDSTSGKSTGNDLFKGKITLPIIRAIRTSSKTNRAEIEKLLLPDGNTPLSKKKKLHGLLKQCGSLDYSRHRAEHYVNSAVRNLEVLDPNVYKNLLTKLVRSLLTI